MKQMPKSRLSLVLVLSAITIILILLGLCNWEWVFSHPSRTVDLAMDYLTIIAFILALKAYFDARDQGKKLLSIYESIDTKYVDVFPKHLNLLIDHIGKANDFICILWDAVDIGSYVKPRSHDRLVSELIKAADRITRNSNGTGEVKLLLWGRPKAISQAGATGFSEDKANEFCKHVSNNKIFIEQLPLILERHKQTDKNKPVNHKDLIPFISADKPINFGGENVKDLFNVFQLCYHDYIANLLHYNKVSVRIIETLVDGSEKPDKGPIPSANFFWILDNGKGGDQGGFLLLTPGEDAPAFCTTDPNLTRNLQHIFDAHYGLGKPYV